MVKIIYKDGKKDIVDNQYFQEVIMPYLKKYVYDYQYINTPTRTSRRKNA